MPTPTRARKICQKLVANPHKAVKPLHTTSDTAITHDRLVRSASAASGTASVE